MLHGVKNKYCVYFVLFYVFVKNVLKKFGNDIFAINYFVENTVDNIKVYCQGNAFFKKENLIYIYGIQNLVYVMDNSLDILEGDIL